MRERREAAGIGLAEVEKATRIRQKYLIALEADEWHLLPGEVVGRGFLRNYANFLELDANRLMDRRRAMTDAGLARTLVDTSAGAPLPPSRDVDYRPKDVDLEQTPMSSRLNEYLEAGQDWLAPIATAIAIVLLVLALGWGVRQIGGRVVALFDGLQEQTAAPPQDGQGDLPDGQSAGVVDGDGGNGAGEGSEPSTEPQVDQPGGAPAPTNTPTFEPPTPTPEPPTPTPEPPTPTPELPTPTPEPPATDTPVPLPTPTPLPPEPSPTPEPQVVAPSCPDGRTVLTSPGVGQVVSGVVPVTGIATHEQFDYYKLEFAPGANAQAGYVYFDGGQAAVQNGVLGQFNSTGVANGAYTIMLTVVDNTGNYPPRCQVTITVEN